MDTSSQTACDNALKEANTEFGAGVKHCADKLRDLKGKAHDQAAKFMKDPLIPRSSRQHLEQVEAEAQRFADALRQFCIDSIADIKAEKAKAPH